MACNRDTRLGGEGGGRRTVVVRKKASEIGRQLKFLGATHRFQLLKQVQLSRVFRESGHSWGANHIRQANVMYARIF